MSDQKIEEINDQLRRVIKADPALMESLQFKYYKLDNPEIYLAGITCWPDISFLRSMMHEDLNISYSLFNNLPQIRLTKPEMMALVDQTLCLCRDRFGEPFDTLNRLNLAKYYSLYGKFNFYSKYLADILSEIATVHDIIT